jgi:hypothetical protein
LSRSTSVSGSAAVPRPQCCCRHRGTPSTVRGPKLVDRRRALLTHHPEALPCREGSAQARSADSEVRPGLIVSGLSISSRTPQFVPRPVPKWAPSCGWSPLAVRVSAGRAAARRVRRPL